MKYAPKGRFNMQPDKQISFNFIILLTKCRQNHFSANSKTCLLPQTGKLQTLKM